jgi:septum formation protein
MKIILASGSPRRAEILRAAGFSFEAWAAAVDETPLAGEPAGEYVSRLAETKARAVADSLGKATEPALVIGADTVVLADGCILGKPANVEDARRMLRELSGRTHDVLTGTAVIRSSDGKTSLHVETTRVWFLSLSAGEIDEYVATGEPSDKAGAYGIQGIGGRFVSRIEGCYFNVMGLPLSRLWQMLREMGRRSE